MVTSVTPQHQLRQPVSQSHGMINQEEEALVPLVRKRKKKPLVSKDDDAREGTAQKMFSQTINISKLDSSPANTAVEPTLLYC